MTQRSDGCSIRIPLTSFAAGTLLSSVALAFPPCTYNGQTISVLNVCSYMADFEAGDIAADLDDGSFIPNPDFAVDINDLLYYLDCLAPGGVLPNNDCTAPTTVNGFGSFSYFYCNTNFSWLLQPTTGAQGQHNRGACVNAIPNDLWFQWTAPPGAGLTLINTVTLTGSPTLTSDNTRIAVYAGASCPTGGNAIAYNQDSGGTSNFQSRVAFEATPLATYLIQIGGVAPCGSGTECRKFEIIDLSGATRFISAGFPNTKYSVEVTPWPPLAINSVTATNLSGVCGNLCVPAPPKRCIDFVALPAPIAQTNHFVVRVKYAGVNSFQRKRLMLEHRPLGGTNAGAWVNARCGNQLIGFSKGILTGVIDSFSPFSIADSGCDADLTDDGGVDIGDLLMFLGAFEAGNAEIADLDDGSQTGYADDGVDISDLLYFLNHFEAGC